MNWVSPTRAMTASLDALSAGLMPAAGLFQFVRTLKVGDDIPPSELAGLMLRAGYERVESVDGCGQFALRGGIFDIFSPGMETGCRIEFFDTEVDSVRSFNVLSQRSIQTLNQVTLLPAREVLLDEATQTRAAERIARSLKTQAARLRRLPAAAPETPAPEPAEAAPLFQPETEVYLAPEHSSRSTRRRSPPLRSRSWPAVAR
jgi:transcription-repair coupling factor (superfamily II helicase)